MPLTAEELDYLDRWAQALAAKLAPLWPPITDEQRDRLGVLLADSPDDDEDEVGDAA